MKTIKESRAVGRALGWYVAGHLFDDLEMDPDNPEIEARATVARATLSDKDTGAAEPNWDRTNPLFNAWDKGFWATFSQDRAAYARSARKET